MSLVYPKVGGLVSPANYIGAFTWALKPSATAVAGATAYFTDVGSGGGGSYWHSDGVIWRPIASCRMQWRTTGDTDARASATLAVFQQQLLPAGMLQAGLIARVFSHTIKSGTGVAGTQQIYMGTLGTTGDQQLLAAATVFASANKQLVTIYDIVRLTATSVRVVTTGSATPHTTTTLTTTDYTVADMDTNALYISMAVQNATETITNKYFGVEIH